jgi:hypothetical protein
MIAMAGLGIAYGFVVLVAGILIAWGLGAENRWLLGVGFVVIALCAIYGVQPGFLGRNKD